jgi:hypothetical protein
MEADTVSETMDCNSLLIRLTAWNFIAKYNSHKNSTLKELVNSYFQHFHVHKGRDGQKKYSLACTETQTITKQYGILSQLNKPGFRISEQQLRKLVEVINWLSGVSSYPSSPAPSVFWAKHCTLLCDKLCVGFGARNIFGCIAFINMAVRPPAHSGTKYEGSTPLPPGRNWTSFWATAIHLQSSQTISSYISLRHFAILRSLGKWYKLRGYFSRIS